MSESKNEAVKDWILNRFIVPIIVGLGGGAFSGYMGAQTAIAVLEQRVEKLDAEVSEVDLRATQRVEKVSAKVEEVDKISSSDRNQITVMKSQIVSMQDKQNQIAAQQQSDGRSLTRMETKLDLLLARTPHKEE